MQAQFALAELLREKDAAAALGWYRRAAQQGHPKAWYAMGALLGKGGNGVAVDLAESQRLYLVAASEFDVFAQKGDAAAQNILAGMYEKGQGVRQNMKLAFRWYEKAAMQGLALAQLNLGRLYAVKGSEYRDLNQAAYWLAQAKAQGLAEAGLLLTEVGRETKSSMAYAM